MTARWSDSDGPRYICDGCKAECLPAFELVLRAGGKIRHACRRACVTTIKATHRDLVVTSTGRPERSLLS